MLGCWAANAGMATGKTMQVMLKLGATVHFMGCIFWLWKVLAPPSCLSNLDT